MVSKLLSIIEKNDNDNIKYTMSSSYIAIYMEIIFDLFNPERYNDDDIGTVTNIPFRIIDLMTKINIDKDCTKSAMKNILVNAAMKFKDHIDNPVKCHTLFIIDLNQYNLRTGITLKSKIKFR